MKVRAAMSGQSGRRSRSSRRRFVKKRATLDVGDRPCDMCAWEVFRLRDEASLVVAKLLLEFEAGARAVLMRERSEF